MRPVVLVLAMAACSGSGDGAVLTFDAPDGPSGASRIDIVLASANETSRTETRQRVRPGTLAEEDVIYYRQRSTVDALVGISSLSGFEVRIEPDEALVPDETFIPFALIYDASDVLVGVGTVNDEEGLPSPVIIKPGMVLNYQVTVTALAALAGDDVALTAGEGHVVDCFTEDQAAWRSGAVWKGASGPQIRLLFPDLAEDPEATDAMLRDNDLDCDRHPADDRDCDDLRTTFHAGQTETCDGNDTDCDGRRLELVDSCPSSGNLSCSATGVQLCSEAPGETARPGVCLPTAACGCQFGAGGVRPQACAYCEMSWMRVGDSADVCEPAVGKLHFESCPDPGCTVELINTDGPWDLKIGPAIDGPFSTKLHDNTVGHFYLRAAYTGATPFSANATSLGAAYVLIIDPTLARPTLMPINLELKDQDDSGCTSGTGNNSMTCFP